MANSIPGGPGVNVSQHPAPPHPAPSILTPRLLGDLLALYGVQAMSFAVPLLTLPYLARALQPAAWGNLVFAEAFARYTAILVEYGFQLSATREIARARHHPAQRAAHIGGVLGGQLLLATAALCAIPPLLVWGTPFHGRAPLLGLALAWGLALATSPLWYFQGMERMKVMAGIDITAKTVAASGLFLLVRHPGDETRAVALQAVMAILSTIAGFLLAARETAIPRPSLAAGWAALRSGFSLFLFRGAVSLYTTANVLILGLFAAPAAVGIFGGAERLIRAAMACFAPLNQTFFPRISYLMERDPAAARRTARASVFIMLALGLGLGAFLAAAAPSIVAILLGSHYTAAVPVLRLLALLAPLVALSNVLGLQWMLPLSLERDFNRILVAAGLFNVFCACVLAPRFGGLGMAASVVAAETAVTLGVLFSLRRRGLNPLSIPTATTPQTTGMAAI
ncbi:oligosaccharide flippase family protein [uncultured Paludibaculum sp.]|uniref:oligosaccharide flippase family protein n=1 Tax=uncultured Paludibaculum sp. TaxID=1765020 RepID=UPI002AAC06FF|nr:oligosaccharide flippase family protein [uncultured Paludibaculum sp.]